MKSWWIVLGMVACSDYTLTGEKDADKGDDSDITTGVDGDGDGDVDCDIEVLDGFDAGNNEDCEIEAETGKFNPVVEWYQSSFSDRPAYNQIMSAPIVASVNDDNGDGAI